MRRNGRLNEKSTEVREQAQVLASPILCCVPGDISTQMKAQQSVCRCPCDRDVLAEQTPEVFVVIVQCHSSWGASY